MVLPGTKTADAGDINLFTLFGTLWSGYNKWVKVNWTPDTLINMHCQGRYNDSYAADPVYFFTDKEKAYRYGENTKQRNDGSNGYSRSNYRFSDAETDIVDEKTAPLILTLDVYYREKDFSFTVNKIDEADFYSEYNRIKFDMRIDQLNSNLMTISASKVLGNLFLNKVNEKNLTEVRRMLNEKWICDSCNCVLYQMEVTDALKISYPHIYHKFYDNSYVIDGGVSRYEEVKNSNEKAPILYQAILNQDVEMVKWLLASGAHVDVSFNGFTPTALAAALDNSAMIQLINSQASVEASPRKRAI